MKPYAPPPPPGASPAPLWGDEAHVRESFGDKVTGLTTHRETVLIDHSATPLEFREYWKRNYGPTIATYRFNADDAEKTGAALDGDFLDTAGETWNHRPNRAAPHMQPSTCW